MYFCGFFAAAQKTASNKRLLKFNIMKIKILKIIWLFVFCLAANNCCVSSDSDRIAQRLKSIESTLPLPYHEHLDKAVQAYSAKALPDAFVVTEPFLDSVVVQHGMPKEMKYLPLALSGMRTDYANNDRCGVWSLPSLVAMRYGLTVDDRRDERFAIQTSTQAALDYLDDLHQQYGDWWYAILAYANSPNAMHHAIDRNGEDLQLWDFDESRLLPNTSVIADLIACVYAYEGVERPSVKTTRIVEPVERPKPVKAADSTLTQVTNPVEKQAQSSTNSVSKKSSSTNSGTTKYKVKKGDTLTRIASKHHVTVNDLKRWNKLKNDKIREGQTLIIKK